MSKGHMQSMTSQKHENMQGGHKGHGLMMIACCIPMLVIAIALVVAGVISASFLIYAVACTLMMTLMMRGMGHSKH